MKVVEWTTADAATRREALSRPSAGDRADVFRQANEVIAAVRAEGDAAVRRYTQKFGGPVLDDLRVGAAEFRAARATLGAREIAALERAVANVTRFHEAQLSQPLSVETMPGVRCERITRPVSSVGLYVPAGSAPLPSTAIMLAVPARIAGCPARAIASSPDAEGKLHAAVLVAAELCGIDTVYKMGGPQAIAALAFGTETVTKVDKIFGPGSAWVTAAKQIVAGDPDGAAIDLPAGPSEVLVIADDSANPAFVAADLLAQAEHDIIAQVVLVTTSGEFGRAVGEEVAKQLPLLSRLKIVSESMAHSRVILVADLDTAVAVSNEYAPEHL